VRQGAHHPPQTDRHERTLLLSLLFIAILFGNALTCADRRWPVHTCFLCADSTVNCWGANTNGVLGNNDTVSIVWVPVQAVGLTSVMALSNGKESHALASGAMAPYGLGAPMTSANWAMVARTDRPVPIQASTQRQRGVPYQRVASTPWP